MCDDMNGIEVKKYNQEEILQFQGDDRFDEAFCFDENFTGCACGRGNYRL